MPQFNIAEAKANFSSLVKKALQGEEIIIVKDNKSLLRLSLMLPNHFKRPQIGIGKHQIFYIANHFDVIPKKFGEYT